MRRICPDFLSVGVCNNNDCPFSHTIFPCETCETWCISQYDWNKHLRGKRHRANLEKARNRAGGGEPTDSQAPRAYDPPSRCNLCKTVVHGDFDQHVAGQKHQSNIDFYNERGWKLPAIRRVLERREPEPGPSGGDADTIKCVLCDRYVYNEKWTQHINTNQHRRKERYASIQAALKEAEKDKYGVSITENVLNFGIIEEHQLESEVALLGFHVSLTEDVNVNFLEACFTSQIGQRVRRREPNFSFSHSGGAKRLRYRSTFNFDVEFDSHGNAGQFEDRAEFVFEDVTLRTRFVIARKVQATVGNRADYEMLAPIAPFKRPPPRKREPEGEVVDGVPPDSIAQKFTKRLEKYPIPAAFIDILEEEIPMSAKETRIKNSLLPRILHSHTYARQFQALLWIEEHRAANDISHYDINNTSLTKTPNGIMYSLSVPGLAEKRPSVIIGDRIKVKKSGGDRWYGGYVHDIQRLDVILQFDYSFHCYPGEPVDVRFELNRLVYRRMHQACESLFKEDRVLFPNPSDLHTRARPSSYSMSQMPLVNRVLRDNAPQLEAVTRMVNLPPGSPPFVVFGPPGTGKTITIVEAIRQILISDPQARILACAPSNSAADIIADRLQTLGKDGLFRLNAPSRIISSVPKEILKFCFTSPGKRGGYTTEMFSVPPLGTLKSYRVIVSTCFSGGIPTALGVERGHFDWVFIDEAGQATEPEVMIPIKMNADLNTNVVLSGDPQQLGPIIHSPLAQKFGLGSSYLDRLMKRDLYNPDVFRGISVVKLTKNFRSHPSILKYPNEEFYDGELTPHADPAIIESLLRIPDLPTPGFPIIFHAIKGKNQQEASSPSWFNIDEASQVKRYIQSLRGNGRLMLTDNHIGVISPYNAQCQKIRAVLRASNPIIKVGSVEEFQGQERRVIILSTVRSDIDNVAYDLRHTLGFLAQPRRFNVAVTRAQALLIIIGDPDVLGLDPIWRGFLNYIYRKGGWKGLKIPWDPATDVDDVTRTMGSMFLDEKQRRLDAEMDELVARTRSMVLGNLAAHETDEIEDAQDIMEGNADRPWRHDD